MKKFKSLIIIVTVLALYGILATALSNLGCGLFEGTDQAAIAHIFAAACLTSYAICGVIGAIVFDVRFNDAQGLRNWTTFQSIATCIAFAMFGITSLMFAMCEEHDLKSLQNPSPITP